MGANRNEYGFTVAEMVVTLVVLSLFMTLFFQLYTTSETQRVATLRRAAANDIAMTNLKKINTKSLIPATTTACDNSTIGSGNPNNLFLNSSAAGSTIATDVSGNTPTWATAGITAESTAGANLPNDVQQTLTVIYPQGCSANMPAKITSTVTYNGGSEIITRATFVN